MGKWDKLNKEMDDLLASLSDEDWYKWEQNRIRKKILSKSLFRIRAGFDLSIDYSLFETYDWVETDNKFEKIDFWRRQKLNIDQKNDLEHKRGHFFYVKSQYEFSSN